MKLSKNVNNKKCANKLILFNLKFFWKDLDNFWHRKLTLKVRILPFLTIFTQLTERLKNFLRGWLLVLSLKEGLVECATVCVKSEVILIKGASAVFGIIRRHNWDLKQIQVIPLSVFYNLCTGYSFWDRLCHFLHKFTWIVLSVYKLNKRDKFW